MNKAATKGIKGTKGDRADDGVAGSSSKIPAITVTLFLLATVITLLVIDFSVRQLSPFIKFYSHHTSASFFHCVFPLHRATAKRSSTASL